LASSRHLLIFVCHAAELAIHQVVTVKMSRARSDAGVVSARSDHDHLALVRAVVVPMRAEPVPAAGAKL